jgi:hypothetical protein
LKLGKLFFGQPTAEKQGGPIAGVLFWAIERKEYQPGRRPEKPFFRGLSLIS